jgi:molecular chaperone DnaK (HSP70)
MIAGLVERTIECCRGAMRDAERKLGGVPIDTVVMVGGSTRIPMVRRRVGEYFGMEPYTALDPDEVVALGASVQASVLSGANKGALLLDVIPLSLGVETVGGAVAKLVVRNSAVPARAKEMFSTSVDGQTSIKLAVYQGEREMAADCRLLGEFHLRGIPPMPAGIPQLEVTFAVDANGVLNVSAHERRSGKRAALQVVPNHGLTGEEVERIERESYVHAREDMARHRITDLIANGRLDAKWIGERLEKHGAKLEAGYRAELEGKLARFREMLERATADWRSVEANAMHRAKEELDVLSVRLQEISIAESLRS